CKIVEKADRFGTCADEIIRTHRDTIYPDRIVLPHQPSYDDFSPDAIGVKAKNPSIVEVDKSCVMADREDRMPDSPFAGLECGFEPSRKNLVRFPDLRNIDSRSCVGHAGPRQD